VLAELAERWCRAATPSGQQSVCRSSQEPNGGAALSTSPFVCARANRQMCSWCRRPQCRCTFSEFVAAHRSTKQHWLPTFHVIDGTLRAGIRVAGQQKRWQLGPPAVHLPSPTAGSLLYCIYRTPSSETEIRLAEVDPMPLSPLGFVWRLVAEG
jgi:hypothetical protein